VKKRICICELLFLLMTISQIGQAQIVRTSLWPLDSVYDFTIIVRRYDIKFELNKATLMPQDSVFLDSLVGYMKAHNELIIDIRSYAMYTPNKDDERTHLSMYRAMSIGDYLFKRGVSQKQFRAIGCGNTRPLVADEKIIYAKTQREKDSLNNLNRRIEFMLSGYIPQNEKLFALIDSTFIPGSVLRSYAPLFGDSRLRPEAYDFLDSVADFMQHHPRIILAVNVHTDIRASTEFNLEPFGDGEALQGSQIDVIDGLQL